MLKRSADEVLSLGGPAPRTLLFLVLVSGVAVALGWMLVYLPPMLVVSAVGALAALTLWLLNPVIALYGLVGLAPFSLTYEVAGIAGMRLLDPVIIALCALIVLARISGRRRGSGTGPMKRVQLTLWLFLAVWGAYTFLEGPPNQWFLTGPAHDIWQLYRAVWRDLLPFLLVFYSLEDDRTALRLVDLVIALSTGIALHAMISSLASGEDAIGVFDTKNQLAGYLVVVLPFAVARLLTATNWKRRGVLAACCVLILRALWLSGSRGGLFAFFTSVLPLALVMPRKRIAAASVVGAGALLVLVTVQGDILDRPMVQRFLTLGRATQEHNFQWRQEQWQFFIDRLAQRPWMGFGTDVMPELLTLDRAATPHNGWLGIAFRAGLPAVAVWALMLLTWIGVAMRQALIRAAGPPEKAFWIGMLGCLFGLITHNMVEATLLQPQVQMTVWIMGGILLFLSRPGRDLAGSADLHDA